MMINKSMLSNRTVNSVICDCYIREYYKRGSICIFELDPETHMIQRKSDPSDPDMWIDPAPDMHIITDYTYINYSM